MVLVRMAHASSLPTPDELLKEMQSEGSNERSAALAPSSPSATAPSAEANSSSSNVQPSTQAPAQPTMSASTSGNNVLAMKKPEPVPQVQETNVETALKNGQASVGFFPSAKSRDIRHWLNKRLQKMKHEWMMQKLILLLKRSCLNFQVLE